MAKKPKKPNEIHLPKGSAIWTDKKLPKEWWEHTPLPAGAMVFMPDKIQRLRQEPELYKKIEPFLRIIEEPLVIVDSEWLAEAEAADEELMKRAPVQ